MKKTSLALSLVALATLAACGPSPQYAQQPAVVYQQPQVYQQPVVAPAPVVVQQDNSGANLLAGMAVGAMIANTNNQPQTRVIERRTTVYVNNSAPAAPAAAPVQAPAVASAKPVAPPPPAPTSNFAVQQKPAVVSSVTATPTRIAVAPAAPSPIAKPTTSFAPTTTYKSASPAPSVTYKSAPSSSFSGKR